MQNLSGRHIHVDNIHGPVLIALTDDLLEVPENKARDCPQCGAKTWAGSRFCRACRWDFDRAAIKRFHPAKLLALSATLNVTTAALLLCQAAPSFLRWSL